MARPNKEGIDYFPLDVGFLRDKKIKLVKGEYGAKGVIVLIGLFCSIYEGNGYYINWDNDDCILMSNDIGCGVTPELISEVVQGCVKRSVFDERVFNMFGVLTSPAIQRRYLRAVSTRDDIELLKEYILLDIDNKNDVPKSILKKLTFKSVSLQINDVNLQRNKINSQINPQSKEKKIKEKNSRENQSNKTQSIVYYLNDEKLNAAFADYVDMRKTIKSPMTDHAIELAIKKLDKMASDNDIKIEILEQSILNNWKGLFELNGGKNNQKNFYSDMDKWVNSHDSSGIWNNSSGN